MTATICDKCSKEVRQEKRGSLTQWIFDDSSCSCGKSDLKVAAERSDTNICPTCFNFRSSRRSGSMTQWIFRRFQCKCNPIAVSAQTSASKERLSHSSQKSEPQSQEKFDVAEVPFPTERYKPLSYIARSALSIVYKCFDRQLGRLVAIKTLSLSDSATLIQFQQEARATGLLKHPHIVEVLDFGISSGGSAYMVLEFVEATNLEERIQTGGPFSEEDALTLIAGVCLALDFAHKKGVYHRDLKPQNILLGNDGQPKLIDFGLALMLSPERNMSDTHGLSLAGTPSYMSPDQFNGRPYDTRSEIYSLGCVLFSCLTGRPPFQGTDALEIANQHATVEAPTLKEVFPNGTFSKTIEHVIHRCLEKDPDLRYATVSELARELQLELVENHTEERTESERSISQNSTEISSNQITTEIQNPQNFLTKNWKMLFLASIVLCLAAGSLTIYRKKETLEKVSPPPPRLAYDHTIALRSNDPAVSAFEQEMDHSFERYLSGDKKNTPYASLFGQGDNLRIPANASKADLILALDEYQKCIDLRKKSGTLQAPDEVMTQALISKYDCYLRLGQLDKLADLENEIINYASESSKLTEMGVTYFRQAASASGKQKNQLEAIRHLKSALILFEKIHNDDGTKNPGLELRIGTCYQTLDDWQNCKIWLERSLAHQEKLPVEREMLLPTLIRLGVALEKLQDYKTSNLRFRAAEKLALKKVDKVSLTYLGQLYYKWAITMRELGRLQEAENKLGKGLRFEKDERSRAALQYCLDRVRQEQRQQRPRD